MDRRWDARRGSALDSTRLKTPTATPRSRRTETHEARARGRPALVATHEPRDVLALDAEIVVLRADGRIAQRGELEAVRAAPANEFVAEFTGALGDGPGSPSPPRPA